MAAWLLFSAGVSGNEPDELFEQANRLYEQGDYREAVAAYHRLLDSGVQSAAILFNLGNAYFQADERGRALSAYYQARQIAPFDPAIQANFNLTLSNEGPSPPPHAKIPPITVLGLTLDAWTAVTAIVFWAWLGTASAREWSRLLQPRLRRPSRMLGGATLALLALLGYHAYQSTQLKAATIATPEAPIRFGPLRESDTKFSLPDGTVVHLIDQKAGWVKVRDGNHRTGWLPAQEVAGLNTSAPKLTIQNNDSNHQTH